MTREQQEKFLNEYTQKMLKTMLSKREDYAKTDDVLSNFRDVAKLCNSTPEQVVLQFLATKLVRLSNLLQSGNTPNNESIEDTCLDLSNYATFIPQLIDERILKQVYSDSIIEKQLTDEELSQILADKLTDKFKKQVSDWGNKIYWGDNNVTCSDNKNLVDELTKDDFLTSEECDARIKQYWEQTHSRMTNESNS